MCIYYSAIPMDSVWSEVRCAHMFFGIVLIAYCFFYSQEEWIAKACSHHQCSWENLTVKERKELLLDLCKEDKRYVRIMSEIMSIKSWYFTECEHKLPSVSNLVQMHKGSLPTIPLISLTCGIYSALFSIYWL